MRRRGPQWRALVDKRLDWLAGQLADPYLTGDRFTVADAYLFVCLNWSPWNGVDLARRPALDAFHGAVAARPAVRAALAAEGLVPRDDGFFGPRPADGGAVMSGEAPSAQERETAALMQRFNDVFLRHDPAALAELVAEDCVIENTQPAPDGARHVGRDACVALWTGIATAPGHRLRHRGRRGGPRPRHHPVALSLGCRRRRARSAGST